MNRVLVTGGAGFIGSHLVDYLIEHRSAEVVVLDDLSGGYRENVHPRAQLVHASITDHDVVKRVFREGSFRYVFHLAAYAAENLSHHIRRFNYDNNLVGSATIINASINSGVECFVFTSSIATYGDIASPMSEEDQPRPCDPYGIAKYAVELDLKAARRHFGLQYVVFRPHNVYGERQNLADPYRNVIGIFMNSAMRGEEMTIFGDGEQRRAFTYVRDIVGAIAESPETAGAHNQIINVGSSEHDSVNTVARLVTEAMQVPIRTRHLNKRDEVAVAFADHGRFRSLFPNAPSTPLAAGIRAMAQWARAHGPTRHLPKQDIEVLRALPPSWVGLNA